MGTDADDGDQNLGISLLSQGEENLDIGDADFVDDYDYVEEGYDLDDALEATGMGGFQYLVFLLICLAWSFNSAITMVTPFFISGMRADMGLTAEQEGIVMSAILIGFITGNVSWGYLSDKYGRRPCIIAAILGVGLFNSSAAFGQLWWHVGLLRAATGFFVSGSMLAGNCLVSELVPRDVRGRCLVFLHIFWQIGTITMVFITYELGGRKEWRYLLFATGTPSLFIVATMLALGLPESPRFLLLKKRREECIEVLERIANLNNAPLPEDAELMDIPPHPTVHPFKEIFNVHLFARTTLPLWAMFFWLNYASYGLTMWLKAYLGQVGLDAAERPLYFATAIGKAGGVLGTVLVIETMPRRRTLTILFVMAGVSTFAAVMAQGGEYIVHETYIQITGNTLVLTLFAAAAFFEEGVWGALYAYSVEVYPSSIRSTGSGTAMAFGRVGGIIATVIGRKLMEEDPRLPFYMAALAFLLGAVAVGVAGVETKGAKLAVI